jgi:hypothetical protein
MAMMLVAALFVTAAHRARGQAAPASIAGCYTVTIGNWSPGLGGEAPFHSIPSAVRLETTPAEGGSGWRLSPDLEYPGAEAMPGTPSWQMVGDGVQLVWSNGFTPTVATLTRVPGKGLVGEAVAETDAEPTPAPPRPRTRVVLEPRPCGSSGHL